MTPTEVLAQRLAATSGDESGFFLSFEGCDGSGKTTQATLLADALSALGLPVLLTREPGGTELGQELRRLVMHGPEDVDPRTEALLYAADRAYHVATMIRPALAQGKIVLEDRYTDSSVAYQGAARELGAEEVRALSMWATEGLVPNLTVYFDIDPQLGLERAGAEQDRLEASGIDFHSRVRMQYLVMVQEEPERFVVIDANGSVEEVYDRMVEAVVARFAAPSGAAGMTDEG